MLVWWTIFDNYNNYFNRFFCFVKQCASSRKLGIYLGNIIPKFEIQSQTKTLLTRMSTRKRTAEAPKDWEDDYHRLKDKYEQLKIDYNEKENHNKM